MFHLPALFLVLVLTLLIFAARLDHRSFSAKVRPTCPCTQTRAPGRLLRVDHQSRREELIRQCCCAAIKLVDDDAADGEFDVVLVAAAAAASAVM